MLKKSIQLLLIFCGLAIAASTLAVPLISTTLPSPITDKKPIGAPYPEVWGYDLSNFPAMMYGSAGVEAFAMEDGDIWFLVSYSYNVNLSLDDLQKTFNDKNVLIKFFKNEQKILSEEELKDFYKIVDKRVGCHRVSSGTEEHTFSDGSRLQFSYERNLRNYLKPEFYDSFFLKTDPTGQEKKYSILVAAPQITMIKIYDDREVEQAPFLYQKLYPLGNPLYLKDDTFIVFNSGGNLILRFNKNFETKFKPKESVKTYHGNYIQRNFFVIDFNLIDELETKFYNKSPRPLSLWQSLHDDLLCHFHTQY
jgi:hypothetical protein